MNAVSCFSQQSYEGVLENAYGIPKDIEQLISTFAGPAYGPIKLTLYQKVRNAFLASIPCSGYLDRDKQTNYLVDAIRENNPDKMKATIIHGARRLPPSKLVELLKEEGELPKEIQEWTSKEKMPDWEISTNVSTYLSLVDFADNSDKLETIFKCRMLAASKLILALFTSSVNSLAHHPLSPAH